MFVRAVSFAVYLSSSTPTTKAEQKPTTSASSSCSSKYIGWSLFAVGVRNTDECPSLVLQAGMPLMAQHISQLCARRRNATSHVSVIIRLATYARRCFSAIAKTKTTKAIRKNANNSRQTTPKETRWLKSRLTLATL